MNLHKYYLQTEAEKLEAAEKKFDFIPDLTNHAAARSLDSLCYRQTHEISRQRSRGKDGGISEKQLREYRDYAIRLYGK
jgi:hypothetical protein